MSQSDNYLIKRKIQEKLMAPLLEQLEQVAQGCFAKDEETFALKVLSPVRVLIALSGGRDSMSLLDIVAKLYHRSHQSLINRVQAVYIHHGLSANASQWQAHCQKECEQRGIDFEAIRVYVNAKGEGVEAAAREARYRALSDFAKRHGFDAILTAHHENDRIETFLIQWLRGAGIEGLAAFPSVRTLAGLGAKATQAQRETPILLLRPWSTIPRSVIETYAKQAALSWVEDESNDDPKYLRNRVRHEVLPLLEDLRPGFFEAAGRSVSLVAEAVDVLRSVSEDDLDACLATQNPNAIDITRLLRLPTTRQAWCLRAWLSREGVRLPSRARLTDTLRQVNETHSDNKLCVRLGKKEIRRHANLLLIRPIVPQQRSPEEDYEIRWPKGETISLPHWAGVLKIVPSLEDEPGLDVERLKAGRLEVRARKGGEKIKIWPLRPSKNLKDLFQLAKIPEFERTQLPLIWLDGELIYAAGLGLEIRACSQADECEHRVHFEWLPDASFFDQKVVTNLPTKRAPRERKAKA